VEEGQEGTGHAPVRARARGGRLRPAGDLGRRWLSVRRGGACCFGGRVRGGERAGGSTPAVQVWQQVRILFFQGEIRVFLNLCLKKRSFWLFTIEMLPV
jgi:hypothetical protein